MTRAAGTSPPARHEVVAASAGSGKTWQLSHRVLALLLAGAPPESVLATTFTRKAAGEILARVLTRLAQAAASDAGCADLAAALARVPGAGPPPDRAACRAHLARLVRHLDRFQVRTLDSFFAEVARRYGHELRLPPGWALLDGADEEALSAEAVARMLEPGRGAGLGELLAMLRGDAAERSVHETVLRDVGLAHAAWLDAPPEAWERLRPPAPLPAEALAALPDRLRALDLPLTKSGTPNANWSKAQAALAEAVEIGAWEDAVGKGVVAKVLEGEASFSRAPIDDAWREAAQDVARQAGHVIGTRLAARARALRDLLARYDACRVALQRERRGYRFDDLPRRLAAGLASDLGGAGLSRLRGGVRHLLLDEFQDTSVPQWRALEPLVRALADAPPSERRLFVVGDVKQAIYGWRQGEARLLSRFAEWFPTVEAEPLLSNWRSSPVVLGAVDRVFADLGGRAAFADDEALAAAAAEWSAAYRPHQPERRDLPGAVRVLEMPTRAERPAARRLQMMDRAAEHVAELARQAPHATIAVLLRKSKGSARLLRALAERGVRASGEHGNPLTDAATVRLALSALHLADHPADETALLHLAGSAVGASLGLPPDVADALGERERPSPSPAAAEAAASLRRTLLADGYGPWLAGLERRLQDDPAVDPWERARFGQLVALGLRWDARAGLRPAEFVAWVRKQRVDDPSSSRVRVMTVHGSKGLEFDAVVLPDLDERLLGREDGLWTRREDPRAPYTDVVPAVNETLRPLFPELAAVRDHARARALEEQLCVLYVAMTRARRRLDLLVQPEGMKNAPSSSAASLLREAWQVPAAEEDEAPAAGPVERWRAPGSDDAWARGLSAAAAAPAPAAPRTLRLATGAPRHPVRTAPSAGAGGRVVRAADLLARDSGAARARGSVVHAWMASITWLDEADPAARREALLADGARRARELGADPAEVPGWYRTWLGWLAAPEVRAALSRAACALGDDGAEAEARLEVHSERPFAVRLPPAAAGGAPRLVAGTTDRVVTARRDGRVVALEVLDHKTDAVPPDDEELLAERAAHHAPQMRAYREALAAQYGLPEAAVTCRLVFLAAGRVVVVPA